MAASGVDPGDEAEVARWMDEYDQALDPAFGEEELGLKELLGLPDRIPPLRLQPEEELAAAARRSELLDRLRRLSLWAVEHGRDAEQWTVSDVIAVAETLGVPVPESVEGPADIPDLPFLWDLAVDAEFFDPGLPTAPGPAFDEWPDGSAEEVLDIWSDALGLVTDGFFADDATDLELEDVGAFTMVVLFMARNDGIPVAELRTMVADVADAGPADRDSWDKTGGGPADRLLAILTDLGAAQVDEGIARLTPLGQYAFAGALTEDGVEVPLLPPTEEMTADDLLAFAEGVGPAELEAELAAWIASRTPAEALDELFAVAVAGGSAERMLVVSLVKTIEGAEQRWRQKLDEPVLRPYAKLALQELGNAEPELEPTAADAAWLLTDLLSAASDTADPDEVPSLLAEAVPAGQEMEVFEQMWRLDHPQVREVLELIGKSHPDKKIAKAARKASFKVQVKK